MALKRGKIILAAGRLPDKSEIKTAEVFTAQGVDVYFLPESRTQGQKNPDIEMNGVIWEIKAPISNGKGKRTIDNHIKHALKQSKNIILDLRHYGGNHEQVIKDLQNSLLSLKGVKRLKVIIPPSEVLDIKI